MKTRRIGLKQALRVLPFKYDSESGRIYIDVNDVQERYPLVSRLIDEGILKKGRNVYLVQDHLVRGLKHWSNPARDIVGVVADRLIENTVVKLAALDGWHRRRNNGIWFLRGDNEKVQEVLEEVRSLPVLFIGRSGEVSNKRLTNRLDTQEFIANNRDNLASLPWVFDYEHHGAKMDAGMLSDRQKRLVDELSRFGVLHKSGGCYTTKGQVNWWREEPYNPLDELLQEVAYNRLGRIADVVIGCFVNAHGRTVVIGRNTDKAIAEKLEEALGLGALREERGAFAINHPRIREEVEETRRRARAGRAH